MAFSILYLYIYNVFNLAAQTNLAEARPELFAKLKDQVEVGGREFKGGQVAMVNERLDFIQAHIDAGTDLSALKGMGDRTEVDLTPVEEPVPFKRSFR